MQPTYLQNYSVNPGSGHYLDIFTVDHSKLTEAQSNEQVNKEKIAFAIPESLSNARAGFAQQTFLGASVRNFSINAGFGDSVSTMNVDLVEDEFNKSDGQPLGRGADVYHNGQRDIFSPPFTGSPVFFNFGKQKASINDSYKKMYDDLYGQTFARDTNSEGQFHFNFGGILQSFVQNRGPGGNPLYSAQVVDPREILSNTVLILNNYAGTTYNNKNMFNLYGFLEYNPTEALLNSFKSFYQYEDRLRKIVNPDGGYALVGYDIYSTFDGLFNNYGLYSSSLTYGGAYPARFPITGTGMSRRGPQGLPYYRMRQALNALLGIDGSLPQEYINAGFGGYINFRGYNYILDLSGLKSLPDYYFFDFDQINLLDLCLEICDITSSELFVTLLPIIEHPVSQRFYNYNNQKINDKKFDEIIAGIIRVDSIDRSFQPQYGAIKSYIDNLSRAGVNVENTDVGFELSNVTTDKFISGAQEVDMYFFSSNQDRDTIEVKKQQVGLPNKANALLAEQWTLEQSLSQQILPFYGFLGKNAVTVPKGFGSYQQIMLDSSSWNVNGVGNYYVATEMELRAALISYERWSEFLIRYNDLYMESFETNDAIEGAALAGTIPDGANPEFLPSLSNNFAVTVPRSVFTSDNNSYGPDGLPVSVCNPPYGYPLYYKRATRLGVQGAGLTDISGSTTRILTTLAEIRGKVDDGANFQEALNTIWADLEYIFNGQISDLDQSFIDFIQSLLERGADDPDQIIGLIDQFANGVAPVVQMQNRLAKKTLENSLKVYNFIKQVADENLGKKFLVKIPREVNTFFDSAITIKDNNLFVSEYQTGPFGFRPRAINYNVSYESSFDFQVLLAQQRAMGSISSEGMIKGFLTRLDPNPQLFQGALNVNFNPITDQHEFNYQPDKQGGFVNFDLYSNIVNQKYNLAISQGLVPQDLTNFIQDNSRLSAYARFDNSQELSFDLLSQDSFSQQAVLAGHFIPDVSDVLDNTKTEENKFQRFPNPDNLSNKTPRPKTTGFVKCDLDEKLYLVPPMLQQPINVHGGSVRDVGKYSLPRKLYNDDTCDYVSGYRYYEPHFVPNPTFVANGASRLDFVRDVYGRIITNIESLNTNHVYALITLPGRVLPVADSRFRDGMFQQKNSQFIKHFLAMDVVKIPEFASPAYLGNPDTTILQDFPSPLDPQAIGGAISAFQKAMDGLDFAFPNRIDAAMPSPVYPDLVALPLLSKERCYGPWVSSQVDAKAGSYSNIGGKIEFIKDENLAPWNFNGYDLMNQAGILQAEFSNSLLLSSERGGFVIPDVPSGVALGTFLQNAGPLITNISVDISQGGIKTTYKMDLYTASFGKLQKQKQDMISNISRERQKIKDERNSLIRKGLGKSQKSINYNIIYDQIKSQRIVPQQNTGQYRPLNSITMQATPQSTNTVVPGTYGSAIFGDVSAGVNTSKQINYSASVGDSNETLAFGENFSDRGSLSSKYYNTASSNINDLWAAASMDPSHPNMSSKQDPFLDSRSEIYKDIDEQDNDEFTNFYD